MNYLSVMWKSVLVILTLVVIVWSGRMCASDKTISEASDGNAYVRMAYHVNHHWTFSFDKYDSVSPRPSAYREPGFPCYLACFLDNTMMTGKDLEYPGKNRYLMYKLRQGQALLLALAGLAGLLVVYKLTGSFWLGYLAMVLLGFSMELINNINSMMAEQLCVPLVLILSLMLYYSLKDKKLVYFGLAGLLLGLLVLCKAIFMYLLVFILPAAFVALKSLDRKKIIISLAVLTGCYFVPVGGWMIRNKVQLGEFFITGRAGNVMALRVEYNKMNFKEWCGAFLYWTPDTYAQRLMYETYGKDCMSAEKNGELANLYRGNKNGYYLQGKAYGSSDPEKDSANQKSFMWEFVKHPIKHLLVALPIGWRSIMFGDGVYMAAPTTFMMRGSVVVSLIYFVSMMIVLVRSIRRRSWELVVVVLPAMYLIMMNSLFTHGLTRYCLPAVGIEIVCLMLVVSHFRKRA